MLTGVFYGSETGNTANRALDLLTFLEKQLITLQSKPNSSWQQWKIKEQPQDLGMIAPSQLLRYDFLVFGLPTWNFGELQADVQEHFEALDSLSFTGKYVALFGLGDQSGYPETYQDALGIVGRKLRQRGATLLGATATQGHTFTHSKGVENEKFLGLALDDDNQAELSLLRLEQWAGTLFKEWGLANQAASGIKTPPSPS